MCCMPVRSPSWFTKPFFLGSTGLQNNSFCRYCLRRTNCNPQNCTSLLAKRKAEYGIFISAVQPCLSIWALLSQTAFQVGSSVLPLGLGAYLASNCTPAAVT